MVRMAWCLAGGFGAQWAGALTAAPEHVPVYSTMQVWIGTGVVLLIVVAMLATIGWMIRRGRPTQRPRHGAHRRS
ncbi:hypothetical protein C5E45_19135 [Nocardia nova]|uniref:Uncharacterized protein n=1 Tax=Nocardia nova TaxID=37330 RepID=A0A2S6AMU6_9NOCA|nr:hypothetical protein C5E45_19135 [Nocardia nova]